ncbi:MAG: ATP-binding protein [Pirellulales bacterium]
MFFLAALAIALVGYSAVFYLLIRSHLYGQFDDGLQNALRILTASVEVEFDDAKWQPGEFAVDLEQLRDVRWIISDERGQMVDHSPGFSRSTTVDAPVFDYAKQERAASTKTVNVGQWRVLQKQLDAPTPKPVERREPHEYAGVRITVARSPERLYADLQRLSVLVCVLPAIVWLVAASAGRWYFRHALEPLRAMSARARSMTDADFGLRLPVDNSRDELAELGTAFNGLLDQLQVAYQREHRFSGDAAHQLRTPLTVLQGQIDVALRRPRTSAEYERTLQVLAEQVAEFRQIVESLLFLARSEDNAVMPGLAPLAIGDWLPEYVRRWDEHPRRGDLTVHPEIDGTAMASLPLMIQLLDNLIENAFNYSAPGTPVVLEASRQGDQVVLSVEDRGMGIALDDLATIFEPFFRSQSARLAGTPGTGLGLAVAARIAAALGGTLQCDSTPGRGSTFRLYVPFLPANLPQTTTFAAGS